MQPGLLNRLMRYWEKNEYWYRIKNTDNIEYIGIFTDQIFEKFKLVLDHTVCDVKP